jgi:hypothetical protein
MFFLNEEVPPHKYKENYKYCADINTKIFRLKLLFTKETAYMLTSNFLGIDEIDDTEVLDSLTEIVNMITGNFIGELYPESDLLLPIPECFKLSGTIESKDFQHTLIFYDTKPLKIMFKEV